MSGRRAWSRGGSSMSQLCQVSSAWIRFLSFMKGLSLARAKCNPCFGLRSVFLVPSACPSRLRRNACRSQSGLGAPTMAWIRARAGSSESAPRPQARPSSSRPGPGFPQARDALFAVLACSGRLGTQGPLSHQLASRCTPRYSGSESVASHGHPSRDRPVRARTVITPGLGWLFP
jgi:hypothetical protein